MGHEQISSEAHKELVQRARGMRAKPTPAEARLWARLRKRRLGGYKFRRQHVIQAYIVDFYCPAVRLVIEVDGEGHKYQLGYDLERSKAIKGLGYRLVRFANGDVENNIEDVLARILAVCQQPQP